MPQKEKSIIIATWSYNNFFVANYIATIELRCVTHLCV